MVKIKNNTASVGSWAGQEIQPGAYYELERFEIRQWALNDAAAAAITSGDLIVNDGLGDLSASEGLGVIRNVIETNRVTVLAIDMNANSTSFTVVGSRYVFRGTSYTGLVAKIKAIVSTTSNNATIRIYDVTNAKVIAQADFNNSSLQILDLGAISNLPVREAIWEVQCRITGILVNATVESVHIYN